MVTTSMIRDVAIAQWPGDDESKPAPGPLRLVQGLINTIEMPDGDDRLADPDDAAPWLRSNGLLGPRSTLTAPDLDLLRGVREGLRAMLIHNSGGPEPTAADTAALRSLTSEGTVRVTLDGDAVGLAAAADSVPARALQLLVAVRDAQRDGSWRRLKACGNDECRWAFYDRSRNSAGAWCTMASCGNKLKNRDFRARHREQ